MRFQSLKHSPTTLTLVLPLSRPPELLAIQIYTSSFCHVTFLSSKITVLSPFTNTFPFLIHATSGAGTPFDQQSSLTSAPNTTDCSEVTNITLAGTDHIEFKKMSFSNQGIVYCLGRVVIFNGHASLGFLSITIRQNKLK